VVRGRKIEQKRLIGPRTPESRRPVRGEPHPTNQPTKHTCTRQQQIDITETSRNDTILWELFVFPPLSSPLCLGDSLSFFFRRLFTLCTTQPIFSLYTSHTHDKPLPYPLFFFILMRRIQYNTYKYKCTHIRMYIPAHARTHAQSAWPR
jgi:hypothetical protein